ncbi:MAG: hypothetical protein ACHREM_00430 [Polyangiales bacterium]
MSDATVSTRTREVHTHDFVDHAPPPSNAIAPTKKRRIHFAGQPPHRRISDYLHELNVDPHMTVTDPDHVRACGVRMSAEMMSAIEHLAQSEALLVYTSRGHAPSAMDNALIGAAVALKKPVVVVCDANGAGGSELEHPYIEKATTFSDALNRLGIAWTTLPGWLIQR